MRRYIPGTADTIHLNKEKNQKKNLIGGILMTITWLGHACFLLESGGYRVLIDPFQNVPGLPDTSEEVEAVYCSHGHFDHCFTERLRLTAGKESPFTVEEVLTFHDGEGGQLRGENTVRRFTAEGLTVVHLGDLGHLLSPEQIEKIAPCDALLVPVGGTYTVDAQGAKAVAEQLGARVVIPMHYRTDVWGLDTIDIVDPFLLLWPAEKIHRYPGGSLTLEKDTPAQVAVLAL